MNNGISSFLRYPGGKSKISIRNKILAYKPIKTLGFREPFAGGAGIFFGLDPSKVQTRWINDINPHLISLYTALRDRPEAFIAACREILPPQPNEPTQSTKTDKGKKYNARLGEIFKSFAYNEDMDQALRYFFINRTVWAGRVNYDPAFKSRMYYSNPQGWNVVARPNFLESIAQHLQGTKITCQSYEDLLLETGTDVWVYLDPPYFADTNFSSGSKLYQFGFTEEDHRKLAQTCHKSSHKLCISYDDHPTVRELYKDFYIYEATWKYSGTTQKTKTDGKELIITNYERPGEQGLLFSSQTNESQYIEANMFEEETR